ncbi:zinc knuckle CX2CX4HX4C containing protein, partial [Tanacetum coccineum]
EYNTYVRALIEVSSTSALMDSLIVAIAFQNGSGHSLETIDIEYEWKPPRCETCKIFDHTDEHCPKKPKTTTPTPVTDDGFLEAYKKGKGHHASKPLSPLNLMKRFIRTLSRLLKRVLIPETTFVGVESKVLIPETTFVNVESRVSNLETNFVGVESKMDVLLKKKLYLSWDLEKIARMNAYANTNVSKVAIVACHNNGISVTSVPAGTANAPDTNLIIDLFRLELEQPSIVVLISGDIDYCEVFYWLRQHGYTTVLLYPKNSAVSELQSLSDYCFSFEYRTSFAKQ